MSDARSVVYSNSRRRLCGDDSSGCNTVVAWCGLVNVDLFYIAATLFEEDAVPAVRTAHAAVFIEFDVALATRALVSHRCLYELRAYLFVVFVEHGANGPFDSATTRGLRSVRAASELLAGLLVHPDTGSNPLD